MNKKYLIIVGLLTIGLLFFFNSAQAGSWLSGYGYRKQITIDGSIAGAQADYQLKLTVHKGIGTDSDGDVYLSNHCQNDFDDIRFTNSDGNQLDYWRESCSSGDNAVFWIEFDSIPASPNSANFYIYYGKSDAGTVSEFYNTFPGVIITPDAHTLILDHLNGTTTGNAFGDFAYTDSLSALSQAAQFQIDGSYIQYQTGTPTGTIEMWIKPSQYGGILTGQTGNVVEPPVGGYVLHLEINGDGKLHFSNWNPATSSQMTGTTTIPLDHWSHIACSFSENGGKLFLNGQLDAITDKDCSPFWNPSQYLYLRYWGGVDKIKGLIDELQISDVEKGVEEIRSHFSKYVDPEPTFGSYGNEARIPRGSTLSPAALNPPSPPKPTKNNPQGGFKALINNGIKTTDSRTVSLKLFAGSDVKMMAISENPEFTLVGQEPYQSTKEYTLSSGDEVKTIYVKFYTQYGQTSEVVSDSIILKTGEETSGELKARITEVTNQIKALQIQLIQLLEKEIAEIQEKISALQS